LAVSKDISAVYELLYNPNYTPRGSQDAHIDKIVVDGQPTFVLTKVSEAEYYDIDPATNEIWRLMDGRRNIREIFEGAKQFDDTLTEKKVREVIVSLAEEGLIESTEPEVRRKRIELPSAFELDVHLLMDSSKSLAGFFRVTRKLIKKQELPIAIIIAAVGFALFYGSFVRIFSDPSLFNFAGSAVLGFFFYQILILLPVYAVHELAHGAVCDYYGGKPRGIGTGLYYLAPFFYCDNSDAWRLSRRARIMIAAAGPLSTVVIASIFVFCSYLVPPGSLQTTLQIGAFFGYYGSLINFSPVIETDGYYILADLLNIPNLRDEAFSFAKRNILGALRRPVKAVRMSAQRRRIVMVYTAITAAWLVFFGYTTVWIMFVYGNAAYSAVSGLASTLLGSQAFDIAAVGVNVATLSYFGLYLVGFVVLGNVASKNIRMKGVKLETIHDKRVSAFLPLPSSIDRSRAEGLVREARKTARGFSKSSSVTLQLPLCVAALKLGRVDQSLDGMRSEMQRVERSFRSIHSRFLAKNTESSVGSSSQKTVAEDLVSLASQFPRFERQGATASAAEFLRRQDETVDQVLRSAFGTVWTLELSPSDYKRINREMLPSLIADDLGVTDLPGDLEAFKKHTVLGSEALAQLSSEIEDESKEVYKNPEVYQLTVFLEPMKSRLVFAGRTDSVEGAVVWLGGMFLYQAWASYAREVLNESALGLKSIRLAPSISLTKTLAAKLSDGELELLRHDFERIEALSKIVGEGLTKAENTLATAVNFHDTLDSLVSDQTFDIGLYKPLIGANGKHLKDLGAKIEEFRDEFARVSKKLAGSTAVIGEEHSRRAAMASPANISRVRSLWLKAAPWRWVTASSVHSPTFDSQVKLIFATTRLVYPMVVASDVAL
jgi:hypothetical protein